MENKIIYLDNAATTYTDPEILKIYNDAVNLYFANPSSIHFEGAKANNVLLKAREDIKKTLKAPNHEVIFTSGATEANNLAIKGYCLRYQNRGKHIITSLVEHPSVLETFKQLESNFGFSVTYLKPNKDGIITKDIVENALRNDTIFISIMHVNNETGAINEINEIAELLKKYPKVGFHVDGVQAFGKLNKPINFNNIHMYTITGHKIHGLLGAGILLKKNNLELLPLLNGGGQEKGIRSGTNDVPHAIALAKTIEKADKNTISSFEHVKALMNVIVDYLTSHSDLYEINSPLPLINPYIINFSTKTKKASVVVEALSNKNIMVSSISACHSSKERYSHVVKAMGKEDNIAYNTIRISLDICNTKEEIETFISNLEEIINSIR